MQPVYNAKVKITDSNLRSAQALTVNATVNTGNTDNSELGRILRDHVVSSARFNAEERVDGPRCHAKTRKSIRCYLDSWAQGEAESKPIVLLSGPAGAGKSAIAQTIAEKWEQDGQLAASFFFSRNVAELNNKGGLIPTLSYQLSSNIPSLKPHILEEIQKDTNVFGLDLQAQMLRLIVRPLNKLQTSEPDATASTAKLARIIVIDGLDECSVTYKRLNGDAQQLEILEAITFALSQPNCPLRFLIASRPETQVRRGFSNPQRLSLTKFFELEETPESVDDINVYLHDKFEELARHIHPHLQLDPNWQSLVVEAIPQLLKKSSGYFIYASVVMRYLSLSHINPQSALPGILAAADPTQEEHSPHAKLDTLYRYIMGTVIEGSRQEVLKVLRIMIIDSQDHGPHGPLFDGIAHLSTSFFERLLFLPPGDMHWHLQNLHSLLDIPQPRDSGKRRIRFFHASFTDFLVNPERAGLFTVDLATACLQIQRHRFQHVLGHALLPDEETQRQCGHTFVDELHKGLRDKLLPACQELGEGLAALVMGSQEEFDRYIKVKLTAHKPNARGLAIDIPHMFEYLKIDQSIQTFPRNSDIMSHLRSGENKELLITYLKKCGIKGFRPGYLRKVFSQLWVTFLVIISRRK